jgi:iron complex outermembrane recepter protein
MKKLTLAAGLFASASLMIWLSPALAQATPAAAADEGGLSDIVVTAQKRSENLQDVPIAVTAIGGGELQAANIDGQMSLPKLIPNVNFTVIASFASVYVRGVGTAFANPGLESSIPVYFDDTYVPRAASAMFSFTDVDHIEVLKGPQGTLYGRNATGGAIRIITHDPKKNFEGRVGLTYGSDNRKLGEAMINVPLGEHAALRIAGRHDENDGYVRNLFPGAKQDRLQDRNEDMISAKLLLEPSADFTIKLSGDYMEKHDSEGHAFQNIYTGLPEQLGFLLGNCGRTTFYTICNNQGANDGLAIPIGQNLTVYGATLRLDYDLGGATISSITSFRNHFEYNGADLDSTGSYFQHAVGRPRTKQQTQEFQIASDSSGPFRYVAGLYYLKERSGYFFSVFGTALNGAVGPGGALGGDGKLKVSSWAPYAQVDFDVSDQFTITAGARYTSERKTLISNFLRIGTLSTSGFPDPVAVSIPQCITGTAAVAPATGCVGFQGVKFSEFTPKLTLSYKPNDDLMVYATYAKGFKSGGLNLPAFGPVDRVDPEKLDDFEGGFKFESGNIRFNGAAFYYKYKGLQIQITDQTSGGTRVQNAASATVKGLEADLTWAPTSQFEIGTGFGFTDGKYKNFRGDAYAPCAAVPALPARDAVEAAGKAAALAGCTAGGGLGLALVGGRNLSGQRLINTPKFSSYLRAQYTQPLEGAGNVTLSGVVNTRSKSFFDPAGSFVDRSRTLLSARLGWTSENDRYTVAVFGENLGGVKYFTINSPQGTGGWQIPAAPRQVYVTAGVKF